MSAERIPLVDLATQHREVADEVRRGIEGLVERSAFILGEEVAAFEDAIRALRRRGALRRRRQRHRRSRAGAARRSESGRGTR